MRAQEPSTGAKILPLRRGTPAVSSEGRERYLAQIDRRLQEDRSPEREAARAEFARLAFPNSKSELWKYTSLSRLVRTEFVPSEGAPALPLVEAAQARLGVPSLEGQRLVLVNGRVDLSLSSLGGLPRGVRLGSLSEAYRQGDALARRVGTLAPPAEGALVALSQALWRDGAFIQVPEDTAIAAPLQVVHLHVPGPEASAAYPRLVVALGRGSRLELVESHIGGERGKTFSAPVAELWVGPSAHLSRVVLANEAGMHLSHTRISQGRDSVYRGTELGWGGELCRSELTVTLAEPGAACALDGLYLAGEGEHIDHQTLVDHAVPRCTSEELYKGVLGGKSTAIFHGRLLVRPDAQKTAASQTNKNLLLSPNATVNTKPGLEIFADDVKAAHGAAVGQLDATQLFYLRTRGLGLAQARQMLTYAFAREVVDRLERTEVRAFFDEAVQARLLTLAEREAAS